MEMMVVLLIVAILAAATAPMVTKKMARNAGSGDSPWVYTGLNNSIAFNMNRNDNSPVIIGASSLPASLESPTRLFIDSGDNASHIAFGNGNNPPIGITADPKNGRIGISNQYIPNDSIAFGAEQTLKPSLSGIIAIGSGITNNGDASIAIGSTVKVKIKREAEIYVGEIGKYTDNSNTSYKKAKINESDKAETWEQVIEAAYRNNSTLRSCTGAWMTGGTTSVNTLSKKKITITEDLDKNTEVDTYGIAIGTGAQAGERSIAIGLGAQAGKHSIAIGTDEITAGDNGINIGNIFTYDGDNSYNIGNLHIQKNDSNNTITLGTNGDTIYIPGNLVVGQKAYIGQDFNPGSNYHMAPIFIKWGDKAGHNFGLQQLKTASSWSDNATYVKLNVSDRRLKNIGEAYTAGLDELKKLDFFHYTFKKDEAKTPHVGVMAQDLQKVFPDAVTEGDDGYLRIRMEDMFYAVINAVKELDKKITQIVENVTSLSKKVDEQEKIIAEQQKLIEELQAQNANIEKRLAKVEKKSKKMAE